MQLKILKINLMRSMILILITSCCLAQTVTINKDSDSQIISELDLMEQNETPMPKVVISIVDPDLQDAQYSPILNHTSRDLQTISLNTSTVIAGTAFKISVTDIPGYSYFADIKNKCSFSGNYECVATSGREQVLNSDVSAEMSYTSGVYSYIYTVSRPGAITINVIRYRNGKILYEYFPNKSGTGTRDQISYESAINTDFGTGAIYGSRSGYASIKMHFRFFPPVTGTYTFYVDVDDELHFYLDGSLIISRTCCGSTTATASLTGGRFYNGYAFFVEDINSAEMQIQWKYPGQNWQVILIINKEKQWDRNHNRIFLILILIPNILFSCVSIMTVLNKKATQRVNTAIRATNISYNTNATMNKSLGRMNSSQVLSQPRNSTKYIAEEQKELHVNNIFGKIEF